MNFKYETFGMSTYLTYTAPEEEYDTFSLKMLEHNVIDGILPFSSLQENLNKKVRYEVTSLESLETYISRPLSIQKIMNILSSIAQAAIVLDEYMLYLNGIVLDCSYIFTDISSGKTRILYLPLKKAESGDVFSFVKGLLSRFQYESLAEGTKVLMLLNDINSGRITNLLQLEKRLKEFEQDGEAKKERASNPEYRIEPVYKQIRHEESTEMKSIETSSAVETSQAVVNNEIDSDVNPRKSRFSLFGDRKDKETEKPKKEKKEKKQTEAAGLGFDIPGVDGQNVRPKVSNIVIPEETAEKAVPESEKKRGGFFQKKKEKIQNVTVAKTEIVSANPVEAKKQNAGRGNAQHLDFGDTVMGTSDDETVIAVNAGSDAIDFAGTGNEKGSFLPYLIQQSKGTKLYLRKVRNTLGRDASYVDIHISGNPRVGRSHADFIRRDGNVYVKDNNSKNHTFVNGEMIAGGEMVLLKNGDIVTLADEVFEFVVH